MTNQWMACSAITKKGRPCPIPADRLDSNGKPVCHVHDPHGEYRRQHGGPERERKRQHKVAKKQIRAQQSEPISDREIVTRLVCVCATHPESCKLHSQHPNAQQVDSVVDGFLALYEPAHPQRVVYSRVSKVGDPNDPPPWDLTENPPGKKEV